MVIEVVLVVALVVVIVVALDVVIVVALGGGHCCEFVWLCCGHCCVSPGVWPHAATTPVIPRAVFDTR